jgi:hypothetical protein
MPRESPFLIVLSKEERTLLETQVRQYTSPYCDVIRAKIVLLGAERLEVKPAARIVLGSSTELTDRSPHAEVCFAHCHLAGNLSP